MNLIINQHSILIYNGINLVKQIFKKDIIDATILPLEEIVRFEYSEREYKDFDIDFKIVKTINKKSFDNNISNSVTYGNLDIQTDNSFTSFVKELQSHVDFMIQADAVSATTSINTTYEKRVISIKKYTPKGTVINTTSLSNTNWDAVGIIDFISFQNFNDERKVLILINNRHAIKPDDVEYITNTSFIINIDLDTEDKITIWTL